MKYNVNSLLQSNKAYSRDDFVFFWGHDDREFNVGKS